MILSILGLFYIPANQSLLPYLVLEVDRSAANSWLQMGFTGVKIIGQVFTASMLKISIDPATLLIVSVGLLLVSLIFIKQTKPLVKAESTTDKGQWQLMKEGIAYVVNHSKLKPLFLFLAGTIFITSTIDLLLISFLTDVLKVGVENLSFIGTSSLLGIALGALLVPKWYPILERKWLMIPPLFALSVSVGSLLFITNWLYILPFFLLQGIALGGFNVTFITYLQDIITNENYTRTFSLYNMISSSMALPGILLVGLLLGNIGVIYTIASIATVLLLLGLIGLFYFPELGKGIANESTTVEEGLSARG